jgi:hypothetical protein
VVQLGFAGSRQLLETTADADALHAEIREYLTERLDRLGTDLHLAKSHFLCGLSSLAAGADTLFTLACQKRGMPQRIFLPQAREEFLNAVSADGTPDFTEKERATARGLLDSPHVIYEQVVSHAGDRAARFEDVNLAILKASDVVVCLLRADATAKPGGTQHLLELAKKRGLPTLEIRVALKDGKPHFTETWYNLKDYQPPQLPVELAAVQSNWDGSLATLPSAEAYCGALKTFASGEAKGWRKLFRYAVVLIILTHFFATLLATIVLAFHTSHAPPHAPGGESGSSGFLWLLGGELVLLATGFVIHQTLHHSRAAEKWALIRLIAEMNRSIQSIGNLHVHLEHLFWLPLPAQLQPLLRTLDVLFLRSTRPFRTADWKPLRDHYVKNRLLDKERRYGQIPYYEGELPKDQLRLKISTRAFIGFSLAAMAATGVKLLASLGEPTAESAAWLPAWLGFFAIVLPVAAVGAVSYAAAMDSAARAHTYEENLEFLRKQRRLLENTESPREFATLLLETESRLLGETTSWYYRRSFISVT